MNLHRTRGASDWALIEPSQYTRAQKIAASTNGILTLANLITFVGFLFVIYGLNALIRHEYLIAILSLCAGRLLDIFDGFVADITQTKSPLGEIFDATIDKICTVLMIGVLYFTQSMNWWILSLLVLPHILISLIIIVKRQRGIKIHPSHSGKISMATAWVTLIGLVALPILPDFGLVYMTAFIYTLGIVSSLLGFYSAWRYYAAKSK